MLSADIIGQKILVVKSTNIYEIGIEGIIVFETVNTIHIQIPDKIKILSKYNRYVYFTQHNTFLNLYNVESLYKRHILYN